MQHACVVRGHVVLPNVRKFVSKKLINTSLLTEAHMHSTAVMKEPIPLAACPLCGPESHTQETNWRATNLVNSGAACHSL